MAEHYAPVKKAEPHPKKAPAAKPMTKSQEEKENQKKYILKKAFKNYRDILSKMSSFVQETKGKKGMMQTSMRRGRRSTC